MDTSILVPIEGLRPFSQHEATGHQLLLQLSKGHYSLTDIYWAHAPLGSNDRANIVMITDRRRTDDVSWPSFVVARRSLLCFVLPAFSCSLDPRLGNPLFSERGCPVLGVSSVLLEVARVHGALRCGP
ncbi:hypothetical protein HPB50_018438 [Hyalomma asiaticum]|uniref:Uncharacterized protein n=1 Tax=Hyalomma asiaticum TaxID=266040 RepID=A0ACB7S463_HYAAI|nr:hypothetical protein HPB50_018438 [Hyalomma asiaticum]